MSKENLIPQVDTDSVNRDAQSDRYTAYLQSVRALMENKKNTTNDIHKEGGRA